MKLPHMHGMLQTLTDVHKSAAVTRNGFLVPPTRVIFLLYYYIYKLFRGCPVLSAVVHTSI